MRAGAALYALSAIAVLTGSIQINDLFLRNSPGVAVASGTVDGYMAIFVVGYVIDVGLWAWMAAMNRRGRSCARVLSTVFFAIGTAFFRFSIFGVPVGLLQAPRVIAWLDAIAATVLMRLSPSDMFYQASKNTTTVQPYR